jgi:uncharacterized protein YggE
MWETKKILLVIIGIAVLIGLYNYISTPLIVTVTGTGETSVSANTAGVSFTVTTNNISPVIAVNDLQAKANILGDVLVNNGVLKTDIVRSQPQIVPASLVSANASGYQASMTMGGKTSKVDQIANLTAVLYEKGATLVSQPILAVEDIKVHEDEALKQALYNAKVQARKLQLKQLKLIKRVASISQSETGSTGTVSTQSKAIEVGGLTSDSIKISKTVSVTYRMW